jgi:hypothetical protein
VRVWCGRMGSAPCLRCSLRLLPLFAPAYRLKCGRGGVRSLDAFRYYEYYHGGLSLLVPSAPLLSPFVPFTPPGDRIKKAVF